MERKSAVDLLEYMEVTINIECQNKGCEIGDGAWCEDEDGFAKTLWKKGWRISSHGTLYCPSCAKKKLKVK